MPLIEPHFLGGSGGIINENNSSNNQQSANLNNSFKKNNILDFSTNTASNINLNSSFESKREINSSSNSNQQHYNNNNNSQSYTSSPIIETDPNVYQFLQSIIQLIYQSRSNPISSVVHVDHEEDEDPFQIKEIEGGSFQSTNININTLPYLKDKEVFLELEEINEINRDLYLWCEHLTSSPLKLDIFTCTENKNSSGFEHILLERWMLSFTARQIDFLPTLLNRSLTISDELNISSPMSNSLEGFNNSNSNNIPSSSIMNTHITSSPISSSKLIKSLYYTLSSMPLYKELLDINKRNSGNSSKVKYGTSQYFPPPLNFQPIDYKDLVKINFPVQETTQGTLSLSVQFPNRPLSSTIINPNQSTVIIYPSRSFSNQLSCNHLKPISTTTTSPSLIPLSTSSLLKSSLNSTSSNGNSSELNSIISSLQTLKNNILNKSNSTTTPILSSSTPIPIKPLNLINNSNNVYNLPTTTKPIATTPTLKTNNNTITTTSSNINITPPLIGQRDNNNNKYFSNKSPSSLSLSSSYEYNYSGTTPPSSSSNSLSSFSPIHNHIKSTSPKFNNTPISPPSSPYRVGYRPLFFIDTGINNPSNSNNNSNNNNMNSIGNYYSNSPTITSHHFNSINENDEFLYNHQRNTSNNNNRAGLKISFGSFQESILSGNMLNTPKTEFIGYLCDLGASGKDMIPPHKKIPFTALYYHVSHDTPYVGNIDLGSKGYRVPGKGLIQLTIFNPCGTPIKTFLVNYDISDMKPETKTFIRQKIISVDKDIDNNDNNNDNNNNNDNENNNEYSNSKSNSQLLRYAIHLRFISPKKRKYYLYKNVRVVFANRHPDEMEKLKVLYEYPPDPRYFPTFVNK